MLYRIKSKSWFLNRTNSPLEYSTYKISDYNGKMRVFTESMFKHCDIIIKNPIFIKNSKGKTIVIGGHKFYEGWYEKYTSSGLGRVRIKGGFILKDIEIVSIN